MSTEITKDNINEILKDLGKEYRKLNGKYMPAEIVMVGGGAILAKYGFRDLSYDIDATIHRNNDNNNTEPAHDTQIEGLVLFFLANSQILKTIFPTDTR